MYQTKEGCPCLLMSFIICTNQIINLLLQWSIILNFESQAWYFKSLDRVLTKRPWNP